MDSNIAKNIYVTGGADGFVKVWTNQKELIREIWFPEEINTVCLLNEQCDILIGHGTKVSIIYAENYKPFYIIKEQDTFITEEDKETEDSPKIVKEEGRNLNHFTNYSIATDKVFEKLKRKEDQFEAEIKKKEPNFEFKKKRKPKKINQDIEDSKSSKDRIGAEKDYEDSESSKSENSVEELITEEMFQKALQATLQKGNFDMNNYFNRIRKEE